MSQERLSLIYPGHVVVYSLQGEALYSVLGLWETIPWLPKEGKPDYLLSHRGRLDLLTGKTMPCFIGPHGAKGPKGVQGPSFLPNGEFGKLVYGDYRSGALIAGSQSLWLYLPGPPMNGVKKAEEILAATKGKPSIFTGMNILHMIQYNGSEDRWLKVPLPSGLIDESTSYRLERKMVLIHTHEHLYLYCGRISHQWSDVLHFDLLFSNDSYHLLVVKKQGAELYCLPSSLELE